MTYWSNYTAASHASREVTLEDIRSAWNEARERLSRTSDFQAGIPFDGLPVEESPLLDGVEKAVLTREKLYVSPSQWESMRQADDLKSALAKMEFLDLTSVEPIDWKIPIQGFEECPT